MPSRSVPFGVKPRTWSATSSPRKPSMGSPASNPYAPTPRACWIPAANTGVLKTVSTTFATSPLMKIARASAVAQAPRSWPPFAISPYRFSASPELATSPQHFAAVLVRAIPSSFASSGCDFDVAVGAPHAPRREHLEAADFLPHFLAMNAVRHYSETIPLGKTFHIGHGVSFQTTTYCM